MTGKRDLILRMVAVALAALAIAQIARGRVGANDGPHPMLPGDVFRELRGRLNALPLQDTDPPCWPVFIVDPACPACEQLATAQTGAPGVYWVVVGDPSRVESFVTAHAFDTSKVIRITRRGVGGLALLRGYGVFGVPTQVALASDYTVLDIRLVRDLGNSNDLAARICTTRVR